MINKETAFVFASEKRSDSILMLQHTFEQIPRYSGVEDSSCEIGHDVNRVCFFAKHEV
jgi:hypothetical protein